MKEIIAVIQDATENLPTTAEMARDSTPLEARDWAGFFAALAAFMTKLLPLILPLFAKTKPE